MSHLLKLDQQKGMRDNLCVRTSASRNKADFFNVMRSAFLKGETKKKQRRKGRE